MTRVRMSVAAVLALALLAAGCSDDSSVDTGSLGLVADGTLTVCTDSPYPPMEYEEDGEFTGFDIEDRDISLMSPDCQPAAVRTELSRKERASSAIRHDTSLLPFLKPRRIPDDNLSVIPS